MTMKLLGGGAVLVLCVLVVLILVGSQNPATKPDTPLRQAISTAPTTAQRSKPEDYTPPTKAAGSEPTPGSSLSIISNAEAAMIAPPAFDPPPRELIAAIAAFRNGTAVPWRHKTAAGTRWSLRQLQPNVMVLLIDLGQSQVAAVLVTPEFQGLDLPGMDGRIEYIKSEALKISPTSAAYTFNRAGGVSVFP